MIKMTFTFDLVLKLLHDGIHVYEWCRSSGLLQIVHNQIILRHQHFTVDIFEYKHGREVCCTLGGFKCKANIKHCIVDHTFQINHKIDIDENCQHNMQQSDSEISFESCTGTL